MLGPGSGGSCGRSPVQQAMMRMVLFAPGLPVTTTVSGHDDVVGDVGLSASRYGERGCRLTAPIELGVHRVRVWDELLEIGHDRAREGPYVKCLQRSVRHRTTSNRVCGELRGGHRACRER